MFQTKTWFEARFHFLLKRAFDFVVIVYNHCLKFFSRENRGISAAGNSLFRHRENRRNESDF